MRLINVLTTFCRNSAPWLFRKAGLHQTVTVLLGSLAVFSTSVMGQTQPQYGPVYEEVGFHPNGGYFDAGVNAVVNHFGGNLILTSTDVSIPSLGGFGLSFTRTYNSHKAYDAVTQQPLVGDHDSPLGQGWTCHYGFLLVNIDPLPEWHNGTGDREVFYPHNKLDDELEFGNPGDTIWISKSLKILVLSGSDYTMYTPTGLTYTLQSHVETNIKLPVAVTDANGNQWTFSYHANTDTEYLAPGFSEHHPLISIVTDPWNRTLNFDYTLFNQKLRIQNIKLNNNVILASYSYSSSGDMTYLHTHQTGENRTTTFTVDTSGEGKGCVTAVQLPTGGSMSFGYQAKTFFYRTGEPGFVYAVTTNGHHGGTWTYTYPTEGQSGTGTFHVNVSGPGGFDGDYYYWSYDASFGNLYRVGKLIQSTVSFRQGCVGLKVGGGGRYFLNSESLQWLP